MSRSFSGVSGCTLKAVDSNQVHDPSRTNGYVTPQPSTLRTERQRKQKSQREEEIGGTPQANPTNTSMTNMSRLPTCRCPDRPKPSPLKPSGLILHPCRNQPMVNNRQEPSICVQSIITVRQETSNITYLDIKSVRAWPRMVCPTDPEVPQHRAPVSFKRIATHKEGSRRRK